MNATVPVTKTEAPRPAARTLADFRLIPRIETFSRCVSFAQTWLGKVALLAAFGLGLRFFDPYPTVLRIVLPLAFITFMPEYRRFVLALTPLCLLVVQLGDSPLIIGMQLVTVAAGVLLFLGARRWPNSLFGQKAGCVPSCRVQRANPSWRALPPQVRCRTAFFGLWSEP